MKDAKHNVNWELNCTAAFIMYNINYVWKVNNILRVVEERMLNEIADFNLEKQLNECEELAKLVWFGFTYEGCGT